jgi:two-component system, OmpR family, osmolarity sensor histidine kinase EnvZ
MIGSRLLRRLWPDTLFARMVVLIATLFLIGQLAIYAVLHFYEFPPHTHRIAQRWAQLLTLAATQPAAQTPALRIRLNELGLRYVPDDTAPLPGHPPADTPLKGVLSELRRLLGPSAEITVDPAHKLLWLRWTGTRTVTLAIPAKQDIPIPVPYVQLIALITLALVGGLIVVRQINQPLKSLVDAVSRFGDGQLPRPVRVQGPRDVRELAARFNRLLEDLERLLRERELVLVGVSHDLRTPLTRTRLAAEFMPADAADIRDEIIANIQEMDAIIEQFMNYAREGQEERSSPVDLAGVVRETVERYRDGPQASPVELAAPPALAVHTQPLALSRALRNLIENAAKHGAPPIEVSLSGDDGIRLCVRDHGPGIPPQRLTELPKPFTLSRSGGAGLGLAIVERIARRLHGKLVLTNAADGGFLACLELPAEALKARSTSPGISHTRSDQA